MNQISTDDMPSPPYSLSFTAASMKFHDFIRLARYVEEHEIEINEQTIDPNQIMRRANSRTNQREFRELLKRYKLLTPRQRKLLIELDANAQKQLAWVGICKCYDLIRDFVTEVVREKFLTLDYQLTDGNYQSFLNRKMELHPELESFSESTTKKARQVIWRMLEEAGLIDNTKNRNILPQYLNPKVLKAVQTDNPELLKIFLLTDQEIGMEE